MSLLSSLPGRPLSDGEVAALNRSESVELAVAVDSETHTEAAEANAAADGAEGLLLATESWVKGLDFRGGVWEVVESVAVDGEADRYDALRTCEDAVRANGAE